MKVSNNFSGSLAQIFTQPIFPKELHETEISWEKINHIRQRTLLSAQLLIIFFITHAYFNSSKCVELYLSFQGQLMHSYLTKLYAFITVDGGVE
jgi:hypothetical protein